MNTDNLCFGQRYDSQLGVLYPWYTHGAQELLDTMQWYDKVVMEWGGGASTIWWGLRAQQVFSVDHNTEWAEKTKTELRNRSLDKVQMVYVPTHEGDQSETRDAYIQQFKDKKPNICIVDGVHRFECAEYAVKHFKPEILVIDNHQQDYVFMCPALDVLLKGIRMERFIQADHRDHSGNPWATAIFYLNETA